MSILYSLYKHPNFKRLEEVPVIKKIQVLDSLKKLERLIIENQISGVEVINRFGDGHYKECSQANIELLEDYNCYDCICCKIGRAHSEITMTLDSISLTLDK